MSTRVPDEYGSRELTARALVTGSLIGALLVVVNVYMGLKTGFTESGNITASLLGFALLSLLSRPSQLETNIVQTTATAAAAMCFATGTAGLVPALDLGGRGFSTWWFAPWGIALAVVGIALGSWLRERMLSTPRLPFPTGIATAEVIQTLHRGGAGIRARVRALGVAAGLSGLVTWFREGRPAWIAQAWMLPGRVFGVDASSLALGLAASPMLLASGALIGSQLAVSVLIGTLVAWVGCAPPLVRHHVVAGPDYPSLIGWLLWPAIALMLSSALASAAFDWRRFLSLRLHGGERSQPVLGLLTIVGAALVVFVGWRGLHVAPWWTALAIVAGAVLAEVATRAAGETDVNPVGTMAQLTQLAYGTATRDLGANLAAGGVVTGIGIQVTTSIWSYKAGQLLGAAPRRQRAAQLLGAFIGGAVAIPAYVVIARAFGVGTSALPAPGGLAFKAVADGVTRGVAALPPYALGASAAALVIGSLLTIAQRSQRLTWLPSSMAIGIGMLVPACYGVGIFVGGVLATFVHRRWRAWADLRMQSIAAGGIAGEALVGVFVASLRVAGVLR